MFGRLVGEWWREPVDYSAYVQYFAKRSMAGAIRVMIGAGIGLISIITVAALLPAAEPALTTPKVVVIVFAGVNAFGRCCGVFARGRRVGSRGRSSSHQMSGSLLWLCPDRVGSWAFSP